MADALDAGAPAIQLRDKNATAAELFQQATRLRTLTRDHRALLFINDRLDIALAADADGVHLGPDDLSITAARRTIRRARPDQAHAPSFLIGFSTDDADRARQAAADGADYIGCGAIFGTASKDVGGERIGTARLADVTAAVDIPVVGIGGVTTENVPLLRAAGAAGAAVISAVMAAPDVAAAVSALLDSW